MKPKRNFDMTVEVGQIKDSTDWNFKLSLSSVYKDSDLPQFYKDFELGKHEFSEGTQKQEYIKMIYNFLKNNLDVKAEE